MKKGKTTEFERLYEMYATDLLRMSYLLLRDQTLAETAVQETYTQLLYGEYELSVLRLMPIKTQLCRLTIRHCDRLAEKGTERIEIKGTDGILRQLSNLSEEEQKAVLLRCYMGTGIIETAFILGLSTGKVHKYYEQGKEKLQCQLSQRPMMQISGKEYQYER